MPKPNNNLIRGTISTSAHSDGQFKLYIPGMAGRFIADTRSGKFVFSGWCLAAIEAKNIKTVVNDGNYHTLADSNDYAFALAAVIEYATINSAFAEDK